MLRRLLRLFRRDPAVSPAPQSLVAVALPPFDVDPRSYTTSKEINNLLYHIRLMHDDITCMWDAMGTIVEGIDGIRQKTKQSNHILMKKKVFLQNHLVDLENSLFGYKSQTLDILQMQSLWEVYELLMEMYYQKYPPDEESRDYVPDSINMKIGALLMKRNLSQHQLLSDQLARLVYHLSDDIPVRLTQDVWDMR